VSKDDKEAMNWYLRAAKQGYAKSQYNIGLMYYKGEGVKVDYEEAMKYFLLSAKQNFYDAFYNIGIMYQLGNGVNEDLDEALKWYLLAAGKQKTYPNANDQIHVIYEDFKNRVCAYFEG